MESEGSLLIEMFSTGDTNRSHLQNLFS